MPTGPCDYEATWKAVGDLGEVEYLCEACAMEEMRGFTTKKWSEPGLIPLVKCGGHTHFSRSKEDESYRSEAHDWWFQDLQNDDREALINWVKRCPPPSHWVNGTIAWMYSSANVAAITREWRNSK